MRRGGDGGGKRRGHDLRGGLGGVGHHHTSVLDSDHLAHHVGGGPEVADVPRDDIAVVILVIRVLVGAPQHGFLLLVLAELVVVRAEAHLLVPRRAGVPAAAAGRPDGLAHVALIQDAAEHAEQDEGDQGGNEVDPDRTVRWRAVRVRWRRGRTVVRATGRATGKTIVRTIMRTIVRSVVGTVVGTIVRRRSVLVVTS